MSESKTTAWRLLVQELRLEPVDEKRLTVLVAGNPVALRGEQAMVRIEDLAGDGNLAGARRLNPLDLLEERRWVVLEVNELLRKPRTIESVGQGGVWTSFMIVGEHQWRHSSAFLHYRLSAAFLNVLSALKMVYGLDSLV